MKEDSTELQAFFKKATTSSFLFEFISYSIVAVPFFLCVLTFFDIAWGLLKEILRNVDFNMLWYIQNESPFKIIWHIQDSPPRIAFGIPHIITIALIVTFGWIRNRSIREKPFLSITDERIITEFGKRSLLWNDIQKMEIEGERKLTIQYSHGVSSVRGRHLPKPKYKTSIVDLKWLSEKGNLVNTLKHICAGKGIPFHEKGFVFFSQMNLFLHLVYCYPYS